MRVWLTIGLDTTVAWPTTETTVEFEGHTIHLRPGTETAAPCVDLQYEDSEGHVEALGVLKRFMSSLAWVEGDYVREVMSLGSGIRTSVGRGQPAQVLNPAFKADYLPEPTDDRARLALALFREGLSVNLAQYQFLGFFKILNIMNQTGKEQQNWINNALPQLTDHRGKKRLEEVQAQGVDVGEYLYESGRCAVAHAFSQPVADPDAPEDLKRLSSDLPLIRALAEYAIERELGVKSKATVESEHLYELAGFKEVIGPDHSAALAAGAPIDNDDLAPFPRIAIRIRDIPPYRSFESLQVRVQTVAGSVVELLANSEDNAVEATFTLDFDNETLDFHPHHHLLVRDIGTEESLQAVIDANQLLHDFLGNGELEVWNADAGALLGRKDPHIPAIDLPRTLDGLTRTIEELRAALEQRQQERDG